MKETHSPSFLDELLGRHLYDYISEGKNVIDEHFEEEVETYETGVVDMFNWQMEVHRNAEDWYAGSIGNRPIYQLSKFLMLALSMMVPNRRRNDRALMLAEEVGAGDQIANAHLATRLSRLTGLAMPCLHAVREWDFDGNMLRCHTLIEGEDDASLTMFGRGVALALVDEGIELEEEILALLSPVSEDMA